LGDAAATLHYNLTLDVIPTGLNVVELNTGADADFTETVAVQELRRFSKPLHWKRGSARIGLDEYL
jgi:hypothetical protein